MLMHRIMFDPYIISEINMQFDMLLYQLKLIGPWSTNQKVFIYRLYNNDTYHKAIKLLKHAYLADMIVGESLFFF